MKTIKSLRATLARFAVTAGAALATQAALCLLGDRVERLVDALRNVTSRIATISHGDILAGVEARRAAHALGMTL